VPTGLRPSRSNHRSGGTRSITRLNDTSSDSRFSAIRTTKITLRDVREHSSTTTSPSTPPRMFAPVSPSITRSRRSSGSTPSAAPITGAAATPTGPAPATNASGA